MFNKGLALNLLGKHDKVIECFQEAIRIDPTGTLVLNNMADVLLHFDRADEALEIINKALEIDKTEALYWETKGEILQKLGRDDEAKECFAKENELSSKS